MAAGLMLKPAAAYPLWLIAGPTASGKSGLALRLAEAIGAEIVNADSMQIYRDLRVLTARPTRADEARAPHHLFGVADAGERWSAGRWLRAVRERLAQIAARERPAIVVGGTGLYLRALTEGLADIPAISSAIRDETTALYERLGEADFRDRLAAHDPDAAARIEAGDRQRLTRAWEVFAATGRSLTAWRAAGSPALIDWRGVVLDPPREVLYRRCDARLAAMLEGGALREVEALLARRLDPSLPAMKALGVAPLAALLRGELTRDAALERAQAATRQYAKRQLTWFRGQAADWPRIEAETAQDQWAALRAMM